MQCTQASTSQITRDTGMISKDDKIDQVVLLLHDIDETRHLMERMLRGSNRVVLSARNEEDALLMARTYPPDVILMNLGLGAQAELSTARWILEGSVSLANTKIVLFCYPAVPEAAEVELENHIYATRPDNFDQLRGFIERLRLEHHLSFC